MTRNYAVNSSHFDGNQVSSLVLVAGTLGTADTGGTAQTMPASGNPVTGAQYVEALSIGGTTSVIEVIPTGFEGGTISVGTTAVEVTFSGTTKSIMLQADSSNGTMLYIGPSGITQAGVNAVHRLDAGESIAIDLNDASAPLYVIAGTTGQKAYKLALT